MMLRKVLITGAAGYLARFVVERLSSSYELVLTDRVAPLTDVPGLPFIQGDVTSFPDIDSACAGQDVVVHLVALVRDRFDRPPWEFSDVMVKGTWNVAEACVRQGVKRLVNVSSVAACGRPLDRGQAYCVGDPCRFDVSDLYYGLAKHLGEQVGHAYHQAHGLSVIQIRPGVIAGDGLNPGPRAPKSSDRRWFNYVDPRDVAQAIGLALEAEDIDYGCFQIVAGRNDTLYDWGEAARKLGYSPEHNWPEIPEQPGRSDDHAGWVLDNSSDSPILRYKRV